ncbi:TonB-dependent receptor family protein [Hyphococcus luteus]|uniref:TonB-dependent receptor n=1 Tax=Hyphococcus luteus TaxID=2058213 RepID=A0A2S7K4D5_9PROT|nr:TonB-dependent receptor [Marinicaulis flavus]PQA87346.1 TonB-dependent receptor [Marinicaulis flavus]
MSKNSLRCVIAPLAAVTALASSAGAEDAPLVQVAAIDEITVFGAAGGLDEVPGAITYLDAEELAKQSYTDILRTLRRSPGVNIQEEDGYGLRPNIGLRGSGSDRSARIMVMEDGVPIAPAPYAAPSAYYFPYTGRINAIEITKGTGAVKYGPRTTGGAINLYSTPIPDEFAAEAQLYFGSDDGRRLHAWTGGRGDLGPFEAGFLVETFQYETDGFKRLDAGGDTGFDISDYVVKAGLYTKDGAAVPQSLEFKYQRSDETSNETYLGLTRADFSANPRRRYNGSQKDQFNSDHETFQLSYYAEFTPGLTLDIIAYRTEFARDWFKLERVLGVSTSAILADPVLYAAEFENILARPGFTGPDGALEIRHNARDYYANGVQGILTYKAATGELNHTLEASLRWHEDEVDRFQNFEFFRAENAELLRTSVGAPGSDSNRVETGEALAVFLQDNIDWGRLHATIGVRIEDIDLTRLDYGRLDPERTGVDLSIRENSLTAVTPAFGIVYDVTDALSVLGGVYRGFAPPSPGNSTSSEEKSTNWEAGLRWAQNGVSFEAIGFFNDYENLLGTCTASTGGGCAIGDQFDGGDVDVYGLELTVGADAAAWTGAPFALPLSAIYTYTHGEFQTAFSSGYEPWSDVSVGDELPYLADHQLFLTAGVEGDRWGGELAMLYQSERRTVAGQGPIADGEKLDAHTVFDLSAYVRVFDGVSLRGKIENLFDEDYIAAHQPAGLRPGLPRTFWIGLALSL